jgi:transcriptional regulator GlxA family with amidase domain
MQIVIALFDRFASLDAVGPFQVFTHLPSANVIFASERRGVVRDESGSLALHAEAAYPEVPNPDIILVPGGPGQSAQMAPAPLTDWLAEADKTSTWTTTVCTGALILASTGLLAGRKATTHWLAMDELARLGATPTHDRYVFDGKYATSAGVSAGIDMALALCAKLADDETAKRIQLAIEYDPHPPFGAGSPASAPPEIVAALRASSRFVHSGSGPRH